MQLGEQFVADETIAPELRLNMQNWLVRFYFAANDMKAVTKARDRLAAFPVVTEGARKAKEIFLNSTESYLRSLGLLRTYTAQDLLNTATQPACASCGQ